MEVRNLNRLMMQQTDVSVHNFNVYTFREVKVHQSLRKHRK